MEATIKIPPEAWMTQGRNVDLTGHRVGEVTVEGIEVERGGRSGRVWRCRCDCGVAFLRTTARIFKASRDHVTFACPDCVGELMRGRAKVRQDQASLVLLELWLDKGTLWSSRSEERLERRVLEDLVEAHGPQSEEDVLEEQASIGLSDHPSRTSRSKQQAAYLYPIEDASGDREWRCVDCGSFNTRVFGCVRCVEAVCVRCVEAEEHVRCSDADGSFWNNTLDECGAPHELSRERTRQVQEHAFGRLRKTFDLIENPLFFTRRSPKNSWRGDPGPPLPWYWCPDRGWVRTIPHDDCTRPHDQHVSHPLPNAPVNVLGADRAVRRHRDDGTLRSQSRAAAPWWWCPSCNWTRNANQIEDSYVALCGCGRRVGTRPVEKSSPAV